MNLTPELDDLKEEVKAHATDAGLDFFDVVYELLDFEGINRVAALGGFPTRYPHWRFGMDYERLAKSYAYGLSKIYEMVINNDPCFAYLMLSNPIVDQKLVMAHVYGHSDFFKNNLYFAHTDRKAIDRLANHGARIRGHIDKQGLDAVERFLDACLSLENLIDPHASAIQRRPPKGKAKPKKSLGNDSDKERRNTGPVTAVLRGFDDSEDDDEANMDALLPAKGYMHDFVNPKQYIQEKRKAREEEQKAKKQKFPSEPYRDVLLFLLEYAPLERWQRDILNIVRDEAYYFAPQAMTKIMNEGWATYWHSKLMTQHLATDREIIDFADHHAGAVAVQPGQINPYKIGLELFRDIEERWDAGRHGLDWELCDNYDIRKAWNTGDNKGREKIFEVRKLYNDVTFIDTFLTEEFCDEHKLFTYQWNPRTRRYEIAGRDFGKIKEQLLRQLTNMGRPIIEVVDGNHANRGELYLIHRYDGEEIHIGQAKDTLENLQQIWNRPAYIETMVDDKSVLLSFDGEKHSQKNIAASGS